MSDLTHSRFGGFLGRAPNRATRISTGVTSRPSGGRSFDAPSIQGQDTFGVRAITPRPEGRGLPRFPVNDYRMVDKLHPVFSDSKNRNARYYLADNFLQAWLAVAKPAREAARLKTLDKALTPALRRLEVLEGFSFEKLVRSLHTEMSRKGLGDFELSEIKLGYWNRPRDLARSIEIDLVTMDEPNKRIRFGSCKRSAEAHDSEALAIFDQHVGRFLAAREHKHLSNWQQEKVVFSPEFTATQRSTLNGRGYSCKDLRDYALLV